MARNGVHATPTVIGWMHDYQRNQQKTARYDGRCRADSDTHERTVQRLPERTQDGRDLRTAHGFGAAGHHHAMASSGIQSLGKRQVSANHCRFKGDAVCGKTPVRRRLLHHERPDSPSGSVSWHLLHRSGMYMVHDGPIRQSGLPRGVGRRYSRPQQSPERIRSALRVRRFHQLHRGRRQEESENAGWR